MYNAKTFGQRVLLARRDLGWEQEKLSEATSVSRSRISEIERGKATNVGIEAIFSLANALGVTVPYLLGISDDVLGEGTDRVLKEQSDEFVFFEVESIEQRRTIQKLIDEYMALSPRSQRQALRILHSMREVEEEVDRERNIPPPRIIGGE